MIHPTTPRCMRALLMMVACCPLAWSPAWSASPVTATPEVIAPVAPAPLQPIQTDIAITAVAATRLQPAPMPDADADAPVVLAGDEAVLKPRLYGQRSEYHGDGYTGTSDDHARNLQPAPGLSVSMPLN